MPRTPSPTSSPQPLYQAQSPFDSMVSNDMHLDHDPYINHRHTHYHNEAPDLKIPLKYQRQSKSTSQKAYKKKFRTWEYDDDLMNANVGNDSMDDFHDSRELISPSDQSTYASHNLHKSSKFRPKGKDYDWRNHETDAHA